MGTVVQRPTGRFVPRISSPQFPLWPFDNRRLPRTSPVCAVLAIACASHAPFSPLPLLSILQNKILKHTGQCLRPLLSRKVLLFVAHGHCRPLVSSPPLFCRSQEVLGVCLAPPQVRVWKTVATLLCCSKSLHPYTLGCAGGGFRCVSENQPRQHSSSV